MKNSTVKTGLVHISVDCIPNFPARIKNFGEPRFLGFDFFIDPTREVIDDSIEFVRNELTAAGKPVERVESRGPVPIPRKVWSREEIAEELKKFEPPDWWKESA